MLPKDKIEMEHYFHSQPYSYEALYRFIRAIETANPKEILLKCIEIAIQLDPLETFPNIDAYFRSLHEFRQMKTKSTDGINIWYLFSNSDVIELCTTALKYNISKSIMFQGKPFKDTFSIPFTLLRKTKADKMNRFLISEVCDYIFHLPCEKKDRMEQDRIEQDTAATATTCYQELDQYLQSDMFKIRFAHIVDFCLDGSCCKEHIPETIKVIQMNKPQYLKQITTSNIEYFAILQTLPTEVQEEFHMQLNFKTAEDSDDEDSESYFDSENE
jgi:hypothetical protein